MLGKLHSNLSESLSNISSTSHDMQEALGKSVSVWRSSVHSILLPPPTDNISKKEAALRVFVGGLNFGVLCFPFAFRMAGMVNGILFTAALALLNNYTSKMFLQIYTKLLLEGHGNIAALPDLAHALYGRAGSSSVGYLMFACQFGFAVSHCIFIGISMSALLKELDSTWPWLHSVGHYHVYIAFVSAWGLGFCMLVQVATVESIAPYQRIGAVAMTIAVLITIVHGLIFPSVCDKDMVIRNFCLVHRARWETLPVFFGIAIFVLESVPLLLAIQNSMESPHELHQALDVGQAGLTALYIGVGVLGYWIYGANTESVIALNVSGVPGAAVKLLQCFFMTVAYIGLFIPACHFLEELLSGELVQEVARLYEPIGSGVREGIKERVRAIEALPAIKALEQRAESIHSIHSIKDIESSFHQIEAAVPKFHPFRVLVVLATVSLAMAFPHFGHMMSIFGCLTFSILTLALPPILYLKAFHDSISRAKLVRCVLVIILALLIVVLGILSNFHTVHLHHIDQAPPTPPSRPSYLHLLPSNFSHSSDHPLASSNHSDSSSQQSGALLASNHSGGSQQSGVLPPGNHSHSVSNSSRSDEPLLPRNHSESHTGHGVRKPP